MAVAKPIPHGDRWRIRWLDEHGSVAESSKTLRAGEGPYEAFAQHLGEQFSAGHRFIHDLPKESISDGQLPRVARRSFGLTISTYVRIV
jgi:hypothetical protein